MKRKTMQTPFQQPIRKTRTKIFTSNPGARYTENELEFVRQKIEEVSPETYPDRAARRRVLVILKRSLPLRSDTALLALIDPLVREAWDTPADITAVAEKLGRLRIA